MWCYVTMSFFYSVTQKSKGYRKWLQDETEIALIVALKVILCHRLKFSESIVYSVQVPTSVVTKAIVICRHVCQATAGCKELPHPTNPAIRRSPRSSLAHRLASTTQITSSVISTTACGTCLAHHATGAQPQQQRLPQQLPHPFRHPTSIHRPAAVVHFHGSRSLDCRRWAS